MDHRVEIGLYRHWWSYVGELHNERGSLLDPEVILQLELDGNTQPRPQYTYVVLTLSYHLAWKNPSLQVQIDGHSS